MLTVLVSCALSVVVERMSLSDIEMLYEQERTYRDFSQALVLCYLAHDTYSRKHLKCLYVAAVEFNSEDVKLLLTDPSNSIWYL